MTMEDQRLTGSEYRNYAYAKLVPFGGEAPLNPLGNWVNAYVSRRRMTLEQAAPFFNLCSIYDIRKKPLADLSPYTYENILMGMAKSGYRKRERIELGNIIAKAYEERVNMGRNLSYKLPPRTQNVHLGNEEMTDTILARRIYGDDLDRKELKLRSNRIRNKRITLKIESPYTLEQADQIERALFPGIEVNL